MPTPKQVIDAFESRIDAAVLNYSALRAVIVGNGNQVVLLRSVAEQLMLHVGVMWESHNSDLIVAYAAKSPAHFAKGLEGRIKQSVESKFGSLAKRLIKLNTGTGLREEEVEALLDPKGWNLSAATAQALSDTARNHLPVRNARKFVLQQADAKFVDLVVAYRNWLAHRSSSGEEELKRSVRAMSQDAANASFATNRVVLDDYLLGPVGAGSHRIVELAERLKTIASSFR